MNRPLRALPCLQTTALVKEEIMRRFFECIGDYD
jgi:hypothetical protein